MDDQFSTPAKNDFATTATPLDRVRLACDGPHTNDRPSPSANAFVKLNRRILLAEDDPDSQRWIAFQLRKTGARVTIAENGQIAFVVTLTEERAGRGFALILMEMQMTVMDGYEATQRLRKANCTTPIIAMIDNAMSGDGQKFIHAGGDDYISKPIEPNRLLELLQTWVGRTHHPIVPRPAMQKAEA